LVALVLFSAWSAAKPMCRDMAAAQISGPATRLRCSSLPRMSSGKCCV
jgi:hypothetical protein